MPKTFCHDRAIVRLIGTFFLIYALPWSAAAQTGTFLDKLRSTDVRVVSYNLGGFNDGFSDQPFNFTGGQWRFDDPYARVVDSLDADVWAFQEIAIRSSSDIRSAMNLADPLPNGASWNVYKFSNQVIASRHPFSDLGSNVFGSPRRPTVATVDLPDAMSLTDLHLVNIHLKAGGSSNDETRRIADIDRLIEYFADLTTPGDQYDLESGTPFVMLGDYNNAVGFDPVVNFLNGDVQNESTYGPDTLLDWDATALDVAIPVHNGRGGTNWTFAGGSTRSRLDWQVFSDSVMSLAQTFILNTQSMTSAELSATGLQTNDVLYDSGFIDHLPVVVDYNLRRVIIPEPAAGLFVVFTFGLVRRRCRSIKA
ncbi:MAG: endonuclease/exonuclease/phosphatase family protein [Planctomycetota bacterium]